jgi:Transcription factor IIA, alpha/beta subunit
LRELDANGEVNGNVQASIQRLQDLAAERQRRFDELSVSNPAPPSTGQTLESSECTPESPPNALKRSISEVSDPEIHVHRPVSYVNMIPPVLNSSPNHRYPDQPTPQKRKPDPNDDTIGSDLDDSEEEGDIDFEDEDDEMPLMLCSYDKVNRTKNKWRANLSHGVVCIKGREWVFERGSGEYEW